MEIRTLNTNEKIPEYFYIFTKRNEENIVNMIENQNIDIRKGTLVSSGMSNIFDQEKREQFRLGDMDYLPFEKGNPTTIGSISPFMSRVTDRYTLEYNLEVFRRRNCKEYPSRLSGIFAFGSFDDCKKMSKTSKRNWDLETVKKFKLDDCTSLRKYIKIVKTNSKIIGALMNYKVSYATPETCEAISSYWSGEGAITIKGIDMSDGIHIKSQPCGVLYEYLIEGILDEVEFT